MTQTSEKKKSIFEKLGIEPPSEEFIRKSREETALNYPKFSPLFNNLYENKIVYWENMGAFIVTVNDLNITPEGFSAIARVHLTIYKSRALVMEPPTSWSFGAGWAGLKYDGKVLKAYSCWWIWLDPDFVREVERLVLENKINEVKSLVGYT